MRDGVSWQRSLAQDLTSLRDQHGVNIVVCLLSDAELRSLGVDRNYAKIVQSHGLQLLRLPIVEMFAPDSMALAQSVLNELLHLVEGGQSAVIHCRGGVGRAGMLGACLLLLLGEARSSLEAIALVRKRRCKTAVESRSQETFVHRFAETLKQAEDHEEEEGTGVQTAQEGAEGAEGGRGRRREERADAVRVTCAPPAPVPASSRTATRAALLKPTVGAEGSRGKATVRGERAAVGCVEGVLGGAGGGPRIARAVSSRAVSSRAVTVSSRAMRLERGASVPVMAEAKRGAA